MPLQTQSTGRIEEVFQKSNNRSTKSECIRSAYSKYNKYIEELTYAILSDRLTSHLAEDQLLEQIYNLEDPWNNLQNLDLLSESFFQNGDTQFRHQQSTVNALDVAGSDPGEGVSMIRTYNNESDM